MKIRRKKRIRRSKKQDKKERSRKKIGNLCGGRGDKEVGRKIEIKNKRKGRKSKGRGKRILFHT